MSFIDRVRTNLADARLFGPMVLARHLGRFRPDKCATINAKGNRVTVRAGDSDMGAVRQVLGHHEYDLGFHRTAWKRIEDRYAEIVRTGGVPAIVDAGANIGAASIWYKRRFPQAAVVAIEPDPENARLTRLNTQGLDNVHLLEAAIGSEPGFVGLTGPGESWAVRTERAEAGIRVVTIDEAVAQVPGGVPFIAKIDIEGFEKDLFASNTDWIGGFACVVIEPHDWMLQGEYTSVAFQKAMAPYGYEMYYKGENIFYIR